MKAYDAGTQTDCAILFNTVPQQTTSQNLLIRDQRNHQQLVQMFLTQRTMKVNLIKIRSLTLNICYAMAWCSVYCTYSERFDFNEIE